MEKEYIKTGKPLETNFPHSPLRIMPYALGVSVKGGTLVLLSGAVAFDDNGFVVGKDDMAAQARQAYQNIRDTLAAANATVDDIVKENVWVTDMEQYLAKVSRIRAEFYSGRGFPANTLIEVKGLSVKDLMIEIEVIAAIG